MTVTLGRTAAALLVVFVAACGPGSSPSDGGADVTVDAPPQDTGPQCPEYCACVMSACPAYLPDGRSCRDFCGSFGAAARACRFNQCVLVMMSGSEREMRCPEAVGAGPLCQ